MRNRSFLPLTVVATLALLGVLFAGLGRSPVAAAPTLPPPAPEIVVPLVGVLTYDVRDADTAAAIPCKLTFVAVPGTPRPAFTRNDIGRQEGDAIAAHDRVMSATGQGYIRVPHGVYDLYVSRGPEWELSVTHHVVISDKPAHLVARLRHVVDSTGWVSADFHVHAASSSDSRVPMQDRIYEFLSDGVEIITSTDHNVVADYAPIIQELGVGKDITSLVGDEMTTGGWGHFGAFPLPYDLERAGGGAVLVRGRNAAQFFADVRERAPDAIIDVHHPRIDNEIGYFQLGEFDAAHDRAARPGFSYDFDALEVVNGYQDSERKSVDKVLSDWFYLLQHGHLVTATGNSDTHHLDHNIGGYPRNYVHVREDKPSQVTPAMVAKAIKAHRSFFTTGPFVTLQVGAAEIGDVAGVPTGVAKAEIEVRAAPWVSVSTVTLYLSGQELKRWTVPPSETPVRFHESLDVKVDRDAFLVVRVDGDKVLAPVVGDRIHFDVRPLAITNPVFLDRDGNGAYDAPLRPLGEQSPRR